MSVTWRGWCGPSTARGGTDWAAQPSDLHGWRGGGDLGGYGGGIVRVGQGLGAVATGRFQARRFEGRKWSATLQPSGRGSLSPIDSPETVRTVSRSPLGFRAGRT